MIKRVAILLLLTVMVTVLVSAGGNNESPSASDESTTAEDFHTFETEYWANLEPDDVVRWNAPHNYKRIGMLIPDRTSEFYLGIVRTVEEVVTAAGYEFKWTSIAENPEAAITAVETWTAQGMDALIVSAQDTSAEKASLRAMEQGVLLVLGSAPFESYHVWALQDYYDVGYQTGKMAADWLTENYGDDATYVTFGMRNAEFQTLKSQGVEDGMRDFYPNGTINGNIIVGHQDEIHSTMETLLTQDADLNVVVTWHAILTLPALNAARALNRANEGEFFAFGSQMTSQSLQEIKTPGSGYIADTWMGDQGRQYAEIVLTLLDGGEVNHWDYAPPYPVYASNADTYYEDYYEWISTLAD